MKKIKIDNVTRKYILGNKNEFYAIRNISLIFENRGFVSIMGKSGSGKSTILNMIACLDKPSEGRILFEGKDINKFSKKERINYFKNKIGILFQNYNLLEDQSVFFNVAIPLMLIGERQNKIKEKVKKALLEVGVSSNLFDKNASVLSGGEKQRVALARTIINEPEVILCDEPTGALDSSNSINVMECLKEYSRKHLVIMVSHNLQLTNKYSDRIIEIEDGKIKKDSTISSLDYEEIFFKKDIRNSSNKWVRHVSISNFKKRLKRNVFSMLALLISLSSTFLAIGFINGKDISINEATKKQLDFGSGLLVKEEQLNSGAILSLTRTVRPKAIDIQKNQFLMQNFDISLNFDAIFPPNMCIEYDGNQIDGVYLYPIYSFDNIHINHSYLADGYIPKYDSLLEVIINNSCLKLLEKKMGKNPLNEYFDISNTAYTSYIDFDETYIYDDFVYNGKIKIVGVVNELDYLQSPKIYYSHSALEEYMRNDILDNLSTYFDREISWYERIDLTENYNPLSSYSYRAFVKNHNASDSVFSDMSMFDALTFNSTSLTIRDSLMNFMEVARYGILLFLFVTLIGTVLIIGIIAFTGYSEDHKNSAILTCLGASNDQISEIYLNESVLISSISVVISIVLSYFLSLGVNALIKRFVDLNNLISIPISSFLGIPFLFPVIALLGGVILCSLITIVPILFSKKISLKEELQSL